MKTLRYIAYILLWIAAVILFYVIMAFFGIRSGLAMREDTARQTAIQQIDEQVTLAYQDITNDQIELAEQRVEWLLNNAPNDPHVRALEATVSSQQNLLPTPTLAVIGATTPDIATAVISLPTILTVEATATPRPFNTPTPLITKTPAPEAIQDAYDNLVNLADTRQWEDLIRETIAFQLEYPNFERKKTDELLYTGYIRAGINLTLSDNVALGVSYIEQARKLGKLTIEAEDYLSYSQLYLTAIAYSGLNWPIAIDNYAPLCENAPLFHDSCALLLDARIRYGDQLVQAEEYCAAAQQYTWAQNVDNSGAIWTKLNQAREDCKNAPQKTPAAGGAWTPTPRVGGAWTPTPTPRTGGAWTPTPNR